MKRALPVKIKYIYLKSSDNDEKLKRVYFRLFDLAKAKLVEEKRNKIEEGKD